MKPIHLLLAGSLLALLSSTSALACSCPGGAPPVRFNSAQAVFVGQMQGGTERFKIPQRDAPSRAVEAGSVRFTVEEAFKGSLGEEVSVEIASSRDNSCGPYGLELGVRYLMYAYAREDQPQKLHSGYCSYSAPVDTDFVKADLQFLRNLPPAGTGGTLVGSVLEDRRWQGSERFANFTVHLRGPDGQLTKVVTDQEGKFQVTGVKPGKYQVEPQFPPGYVGEFTVEAVKVDDRGTAGIYIKAYINGSITGRLLDREGRGYNDALLLMEPESAMPDAQQLNDTGYGYSSGGQGRFQFVGVPPGRYRMYFELRHVDYRDNQRYYYPGTLERAQAVVLELGRGAALRDLEFRLPEGFVVHTVEGQVVSPEGRPVAKAMVGLHCARSSNLVRGVIETMMTHEVNTDAAGRFRLEAISGTTYLLQARIFETGRNSAYEELHSPRIPLITTTEVRNQQLVLSERGSTGGCPPWVTPVVTPKLAVPALIAQARQRLDIAQLIEPPGLSARDTLLQLRRLAPKHAELEVLERLLSDQLLEQGKRALRARAYERSAQLLGAAREVGAVSDPAALMRAELELKTAREELGR